MYEKSIEAIINRYGSPKEFTYTAPTSKMLEKAEKFLNFKLPEDFIWFLNKYGAGGIGFEIFGIVNDEIEFISKTEYYRNYGIPEHLLVIENCDEWVNCIDLRNNSIVEWDQLEGVSEPCYDSFSKFLLDRLENSVENLE